MNIKLIQKMLKYNSEKNDNWCFKSWHKYNNKLWFFNGFMMVAIPKHEEAKTLRFYPEESKQKINIGAFIPKNWEDWGNELEDFSFNQEYLNLIMNIWNRKQLEIKIKKYHMIFIKDNEVIAYILGRR